MNVHVLQHVPFEGLGSIGPWLERRGDRVTWTRFFESADLPPLSAIDFVIALGGPMSVHDEGRLPWLQDEKRFIADAVAAGKIMLGICLGAQLIAAALGARVYPGQEKEIGWFPVYGEPMGAPVFRFPQSIDVFHWHGETFDLPSGAVRLAGSAAYHNQAFQIGARIIGLQFHLEMTPEGVQALIDHCADELLSRQRCIQDEATLLAVPVSYHAGSNALMTALLEHLVRQS